MLSRLKRRLQPGSMPGCSGYIYKTILGVSLVACLMLSGCKDTAKADSIPDLSNAVWLVAGPFDNPQDSTRGSACLGFDKDYLAAAGGEVNASPVPGNKTDGIVWQEAKAANGQLNFNSIFGLMENKVAYAFLQFSAMKECEAALKLGSDDGIKVYLNGQPVFYNHAHRALVPGEDALLVSLRKGLNSMLVKVDQAAGGWEFSALFREGKADISAWQKVRHPNFKIISGSAIVGAQSPINCFISTEPAFAVSEPVHVSLQAEDGSILAQTDTVTGRLLSLQPEKAYTGLVWIQAEGRGRLANLVRTAYAVCGDYQVIARKVREQTAKALARLHDVQKRQAGEDPGASLEFHIEQIEGQLPVSLMQNERIVRSLAGASLLSRLVLDAAQDSSGTYQPGAVRGYNQWAYRSAIDNSLQPYSLYVPHSYTAEKKYPLIVALHGYSQNDYGDGSNVASLAPEDFLVLSCFGRGDMGYMSTGEQDVLDTMEIVKHSYNIDPDRIYLMGWSMGGFGTWRLGQFYADRFAALAPFCGWTGTTYLDNLRNLPVRIVHGNRDNTVPINMDREAAGYLKQKGYDVTFEELDGVGHSAWSAWIGKADGQASGGNKIFEYFRKYKRNPWPRQVTLTADNLRYCSSYWVKINDLAAAPTAGVVDARITGPARLEVKTKGVTLFTLDLAHPALQQTGKIEVVINNETVQVSGGAQRTFKIADLVVSEKKSQATWCVAENGPVNIAETAVKAPHTYGGLTDLFFSPVIIVYGTRINTSALQKAANELADWSPTYSFQQGSKLGKFLVKADREVTEADLQEYNLLLLGKEQENTLTARWAQRLPVRMNRDSLILPDQELKAGQGKQLGFVMAFPNPDNPQRLLGLIAPPAGKISLEVIINFRSYCYGYMLNGESLSERPLPDVLVYDNWNKKPVWQGWFDLNWSRLKPWNPQL